MECEIKLFGLSANNKLARAVAEELHQPLSQIDIQRFADGEIYERVLESVRGDDVYIVAPIAEEVNDAFMEIMIVIDALRRASAGQIHIWVMPAKTAKQSHVSQSRLRWLLQCLK